MIPNTGNPPEFTDKPIEGSTGGTVDECTPLKPKPTHISDLGIPELFRGWVDVQGQGANNDYCR